LGRIEEDMKVILIGYRASGKSTIGRLLADKLNIPFADTDAMLEEMTAMPIKEMVARHGWEYFRVREKEAVQELVKKPDCVIATGGGVILDSENVQLLKQMGVIIWLHAPLLDIIERLKEDACGEASRPKFTDDSLLQETIEILQERNPLYEKTANMTFSTEDKSALAVVEDICRRLFAEGNLIKLERR
jgi:shikimate kinase